MGQKLSPEQLALYNRLDEILWHDWDPIGVSAIEEARGEYYGYLPELFQMVLEDAPSSRIAAYLHRVASEEMGLESSLHAHMPTAEKIHHVKEVP
jgi:hypothetical protein